MVEFFPYKRRMTQYKNRYTNAYANAIDNVDDWMSSSQQSKEDNLTFNRQHLVDKCINLSGIPYWFPTNGATSALCQAINVLSKPNDKIIIQGWGFIQPLQSILWMNRQVVFCDSDVTGLMSVDSLLSALNDHPDIKLIIVVNLGGRISDIKKIKSLIPPDVKIIEDSAQSFYMGDGGIIPGMYSDAIVYSFDLGKRPASTGTGGAFATHNKELRNLIKSNSQHGFTNKIDTYNLPATKNTMDDTTASVIHEDIIIVEGTKTRDIQRENYKFYKENIDREQLGGENKICSYSGFFCKTTNSSEAIKVFNDSGIGRMPVKFYPSAANYKPFNTYPSTSLNYSKRLSEEYICIPTHPFMSVDERDRIVEISNKL